MISRAQFDREEVIVTLRDVVATGGKGGLPNWMALTVLRHPPRHQSRGRDFGMAETEVAVALEKIRKNGDFFCKLACLSPFSWLKTLKENRMLPGVKNEGRLPGLSRGNGNSD